MSNGVCLSQPQLLFCAAFIRLYAALLPSQREDEKSQLIHLGQQMPKEPLLFTQILSIVFFFTLTAARKGWQLLITSFQRGRSVFFTVAMQVYDTGDHDMLVAANRDAQTRDINSNYKIFYELIIKYSKFGFPFPKRQQIQIWAVS